MTDIVDRLKARARDLLYLAEDRFFELGENPYSKGRAEDAQNAAEAAAEVERLRAEVASLRLTLGGKTFGPDVPEPIGCPLPGACAQVAEIKRLRAALHRIILGSQNSGTTKEGLGQDARAALGEAGRE